MARGRKKGGYDINSLTDTSDIIDKIIHQTNSLNKKISAFNKKDISEHSEYIHTFLTNDMVQFNESGQISKSKKFYEGKNQLWLKKTLSALHKINNHSILGTVNKYQKEVNINVAKVQSYVNDYFTGKGYTNEYIQEITNDKRYLASLFNAFNEGLNGYTSEQVIDKIAVNYDYQGITMKEADKILSNIEHGRNTANRLKETNEAFAEFKKNRNQSRR